MAEVRRVTRMTLGVGPCRRLSTRCHRLGATRMHKLATITNCMLHFFTRFPDSAFFREKVELCTLILSRSARRRGWVSPTVQVQDHLGCGAVRLWRVSEVTPFCPWSAQVPDVPPMISSSATQMLPRPDPLGCGVTPDVPTVRSMAHLEECCPTLARDDPEYTPTHPRTTIA